MYSTLLTGDVKLSQAGHPHPAIQRKDGTIEQDGTGGFPVGLMSGIEFEQTQIRLAPGDRMLLLSDGITECPNSEGDMLEEAGLEGIMRQTADISGPKFFDALIWNLGAFAGTDEFPDDISGILFEFKGVESPDIKL